MNVKIGELAKAANTPVETIRYYERAGLLPDAARTESNYRIYGEAQRDRLIFIRHCRGLDMTLDEIRLLLRFKDSPSENCAQVNTLIDEHIGHVSVRIRELKNLERQLKTLRKTCGEARESSQCGILNGLSACREGESLTGKTGHVHGAHTMKS
ncbi:MAG: Cd(II)/Pb(II)-responsive transcriptional regulator [Azoarcus sp.]|jgi:Cd(II)/Pb(II)-responsive transcriptional regulator|nr:Cd(II)/Pb(II)-responsive transcriptional regulator [Azoarcus sp.]